jgi:hypothetical protein
VQGGIAFREHGEAEHRTGKFGVMRERPELAVEAVVSCAAAVEAHLKFRSRSAGPYLEDGSPVPTLADSRIGAWAKASRPATRLREKRLMLPVDSAGTWAPRYRSIS